MNRLVGLLFVFMILRFGSGIATANSLDRNETAGRTGIDPDDSRVLSGIMQI